MKLFICILLFTSTSLISLAQTHVTGEVVDTKTGNPLEYATVSLLQPGDSAVVSGGYTDNQGGFDILIAPGSYLIKVQYVSYDTKVLNAIKVGDAAVNLGKLSLSEATATLEAVTVTGRREQAVLELDRRVFNVSENTVNAGRNASEVLDNLPSVSVDTEGNVNLRGSGNVRILINGKPSGLVGIGDTQGLRNLSGDMIERIEVITNPSSRYDAQGSGGIINIILKKKRDTGLNGSFTVNAGHPTNYGGAVNLNYGKERVNFFLNYGIFYRNAPGISTSNIYRNDMIILQDQKRIRGGLSNNIRFGTEYNIGEKSTLTASLLYNTSKENNLTNIAYNNYNLSEVLLNRTLRTDHEREDEENQEYELGYRKTFAKKGRELTATVQYRKSDDLEKSELANYADLEEQQRTATQRSSNGENESQWLLQADYVHPVLKKGNIELGTRNTLKKLGNDYLVEEQAENGTWMPLENFSNNLRYDENVYAFYAMFNNKTGNWSYQAGARAEATDIGIALLGTAENYDKNYIKLFPSAALTYNLQKGKSIQGSYSRRINRPNSRSLNPFSSFSDTLNLRVGNPDLDPEYTDSYEVGYLHNFKIGNIYTGGYYRHTTGVEQRVSRQTDGVIYTRPENIGIQNSFGIEINTNLDLADWWNVNGNFNFYRAITRGEAEGLVLNSDTYTMMSRVNSKWKIPNVFDVQLNAFYMAPEKRPQGSRKAMYAFDLGLSKTIMRKKGTVTLNAQDLFNTRKYRFVTEGKDFRQEGSFQWRKGPQVVLTFSYRLNQNTNNRSQREQRDGNSGGGGDEGGGDF